MGSQLQNGKQQFETILGTPLVGGKVYFYAPGTETPKATYQDQALTIANTNPVVLDARGQAIIWGSGTYRQVVVDAFGVQIWDQIVAANVSASDLAGSGGAAMVGLPDGTTLAESLTLNLNRVVDSIADLRTLDHTFYARAFVTGYYAPHDGGGGGYQYDPNDVASLDNGGTVIVANDGGRWKLQFSSAVSLLQFGAKADGAWDNTAAIQACVNAVIAVGGRMYVPGTTKAFMCQTINLGSSFEAYGDGPTSVVKLAANVNTHLFTASSATGITLRNFVLDGNKANQTNGAISRCFYALECSDVRLEDMVVQNAADHGAHVSTGDSTQPLSNAQRIWVTRCKFMNNGTTGTGGNGGSTICIRPFRGAIGTATAATTRR